MHACVHIQDVNDRESCTHKLHVSILPRQAWVIPYQINKDFHEICQRHGLYKETFSHQNLAGSIDLPLRYDHLNFVMELFCLDFGMLIKFSFRWHIMYYNYSKGKVKPQKCCFSFDVYFFKKRIF